MRRSVHVMCWLFAAGCANESAKNLYGADAETGQADTASADTGDFDSDGIEPVWWSLDAAVTLVEGVPDATQSGLSLTLLAVDGAELCGDTLHVAQIVDLSAVPDPVVFSWWEISPLEPDGDCTPWRSPVPSDLQLGVGAMDPNIEANLAPAGMRELDDNLNASYASLDGGDTVYVFGVAGKDTAWLDVDLAATSGPLDDGTWIIKAIYPFSYR